MLSIAWTSCRKKLVVSLDSDFGGAAVACSVDAIEDIYHSADGQTCFPPLVWSTLRPEERQRAFVIVFAGPGNALCRLCLLEQSRQGRDVLMACLRLLRTEATPTPALGVLSGDDGDDIPDEGF
mmetsp:Transcript_33712/g.95601  ORF Transcript_33712/g.95601 Transcript_33712/m.95601 type:complete len:124 (+) Transcript_33712:324-695(+)